MKKNKFTWLFASSALFAVGLTTNTVKADATADSNSKNQASTDNNQTTDAPNSDIFLNKTANDTANISDANKVSNNDSSNEATNKHNNSLNTDNTTTNKANSVNTGVTSVDDNIITSTWGTAPITLDKTTGILTVDRGTIKASSNPMLSNDSYYFDNNSKVNSLRIKKIIFNDGVSAAPDASKLFYRLYNLTDIEGILDTSEVTNMNSMFVSDTLLESLDVSTWDTSNVTSMVSTFYDCWNLNDLKSLDVSKWDTSNVTNMSHMFHNYGNNNSLNVKNWNTSKVTNMSYMFYYCNSITSLDVSKWDTSNVTTMKYMFAYNNALTELDVSKWDTSKVTNMFGLFTSCPVLTSLDVREWNTSKVTSMYAMFSYCPALTSLDLSKWNTSKVTDMMGMFAGMENLESLSISNFGISVDELLFLDDKKLSKITLGQSTRFSKDGKSNKVDLPAIDTSTTKYTGRWIKVEDNIESYFPDLDASGKLISAYASSDNFMNQYNGSHPGTYMWEQYGVITRYVDEKGMEIFSKIDTGNLGNSYSTSAPDSYDNGTNSYTLVSSPSTTTGTYNTITPTEVVTYVYKQDETPVKVGAVTVAYVDENGNTITASKTYPTGEIGSSYDATTSDYKIDIDGYTLDETKLPINAKGTFTDVEQTVTYVYSENSNVDPNPDPTPTPNPDNPIPKKDYQILKVVYTGKGQVRLLNSDGTYLDKYVKNNVEYTIWDKKTINNTLMYCIGTNNEWIPSGYTKIQRDISVIDRQIKVIYSGKGKVRLLSADGKYLDRYISNNDKYTILETKNINNRLMYRINTQDMWVPADYTYTNLDKNKQVTVNYLPNWGIAVWNEPAGKPTGEFLKTGSKHQVIGYAIRDANVWLQVGESQWLDANYLI